MPADLWGQPFRAQAVATNYPFDDRATLEADSGLLLSPDMVLDARLSVPGVAGRLGLTSVGVTLESATFVVGNADLPAAASGTFDPRDPPEVLPLADPLGRPAGQLVLNPPAVAPLQAWPPGTHTFADGAAEFVASAVEPLPAAGLEGFAVGGVLLADDVVVLGHNGVAASAAGDSLRLDVTGDPLFRRRACLDAGEYTTPAFLRTINGAGPDARGGFLLVVAPTSKGATVLRIDAGGPDTLVFSAAGG